MYGYAFNWRLIFGHVYFRGMRNSFRAGQSTGLLERRMMLRAWRVAIAIADQNVMVGFGKRRQLSSKCKE